MTRQISGTYFGKLPTIFVHITLKINIPKRKLNSYIASFVASYLAERLILTKQSFCFETVLSHPSKISLLKLASGLGYKTYLYFIFTDDWRLNIERVKLRVQQGGHNVDEKKIEQRYFRSLKLFSKAAVLADTAYLIDNSSDFKLMAEVMKGKSQQIAIDYPEWLRKYYSPIK